MHAERAHLKLVCIEVVQGMQPAAPWLSRRYFTVPRPLLQSIVATSGTTPAAFPRGSSINVAAQLTSLTKSAPALARRSQLVGSAAAGCTALNAYMLHKAVCTLLCMRSDLIPMP